MLLEMLVRKCGFDAVRAVMPEEHMKLLTNIRKVTCLGPLIFVELCKHFIIDLSINDRSRRERSEKPNLRMGNLLLREQASLGNVH